MKFELNEKTNEYTLVAGDDVPTVVIPREYNGKPVTRIGRFAFYCCTSLKSVTIGNGVTNIGAYAFSGCTSLRSVRIPDSVTDIDSRAFYNCPIETATIPAMAYKYVKNNSLKTVTITSGTSIGNNAFDGCTLLTTITIPDSVTSIGSRAFYGCTALTRVNYNGDMAHWNKIIFGNEFSNPLYYGATLHTKLEKRERKQLMKFILNGCDISFIAEAPEDITLKQLIKQCDKIIPDWCACGICSLDYKSYNENIEPDIIIGVDSIKKANEAVSCSIREKENESSND